MGWQEVPISGSSSTSPTGTPGAAVTRQRLKYEVTFRKIGSLVH